MPLPATFSPTPKVVTYEYLGGKPVPPGMGGRLDSYVDTVTLTLHGMWPTDLARIVRAINDHAGRKVLSAEVSHRRTLYVR